ncbi:MAG: D-2-hydroxyacid dehydrogenase [Myxococcota bacterium]
MTTLLVGPGFAARHGERVRAVAKEAGADLELLVLPDDPAARVPADDVARIDAAFFSGDVFPERSPAFFAATLGAGNLRWMHCFNAGVDHPVFGRFVERGVVLTSSPGSNAVPIAQNVIAGLLALARRLPLFARAQRDKVWIDHAKLPPPPDLDTQTLVVLGLGGIGSEIARLGRSLGLRVVGVKRSRPPADAPVDAWLPPADLAEALPLCDWLAIACPLTEETRGWIDAAALRALPDGACVLNVGRGEIVDEAALVAELASGRLGGAYLDVFVEEPLPASSPLWELPNVIVTPHASSISAGSQARQAEMFFDNLGRWLRREELANRVGRASS